MKKIIPNIEWKETTIAKSPIPPGFRFLVRGKYINGCIPYEHTPGVSQDDIEKEIDLILAIQEARLSGNLTLDDNLH